MTDRELLQKAFKYLKDITSFYGGHRSDKMDQLMLAIEIELAEPEQEPVAHAIIAGVLFDFMGWLTSRQERIVLSSCDDASPVVKVIEEFAKMRGLSLDDAKVKDWQDMTAPPRKPWVSLSSERLAQLTLENLSYPTQLAAAISAELKEKNT